MKPIRCCLTLATTGLLFAGTALAGAPENGIRFSEPLDMVQSNGKTMQLSVGIGSGAFRLLSDPEGVIYTITDRGPNIETTDGMALLGVDSSGKEGKIFPTPNFAPAIYKLEVKGGKASVLEKIQLKTASGKPISGLSNPDTEKAWDITGQPLPYDPNGVDAEGIIKLKDGTFWIGDEYGPSILHVSADGRILERWVPQGVKTTLTGADYAIQEVLPGILRKRPLNRGIESMAISPDEKFLYFSMQSPLSNPNTDAYKNGRNVRIFKIDREAGKLVGEYVYLIDSPETFKLDNQKKPAKQNDVKVSELTAVGTDKLVVLERISKTTKFYQVDLGSGENILGSSWDDVAKAPSLEQAKEGDVKLLAKTLLLSTDDRSNLMEKIEGLAWLGKSNWIMINDSDFGITGDATYVVPVTMPLK